MRFFDFNLLLLLTVCTCGSGFAQDTLDSTVVPPTSSQESIDTDSARLHMQLDELHESAKRSFTTITGTRREVTGEGTSIFESKLELLGSNSNHIEKDPERNYTFVSRFNELSKEEALEKQEALTSVLLKRVKPEGYKRSRGADMRYYQYRKNSVDFDSDNIDELGKHPSFVIGIIEEDDGTFTVELLANDPLWK